MNSKNQTSKNGNNENNSESAKTFQPKAAETNEEKNTVQETLVERIAKTTVQGTPTSEQLLEICDLYKSAIADHKKQIEALRAENKGIPRAEKTLGILKAKVSPEQRKVNKSKIGKLRADLVIYYDLLSKFQKQLKEISQKELEQYRINEISNKTKSLRYIQKNQSFIGGKFTKLFNDILQSKLAGDDRIPTIKDLIELQNILPKSSNKNIDSDKENEFDEKLTSIFWETDAELVAFYSNDLKPFLRQAIQTALKAWDSKKSRNSFPEIEIPSTRKS